MLTKEQLDELTREQLAELLLMDSKNVVAMDGAWFQSLERKSGMDCAMQHDEEAWKVYTRSEARRIKKFLSLPERPGLEGLARALPYRMVDRASPSEIILDNGKLIYRITACRVQEARTRKKMPLHPCKSAAVFEYGGFAEVIDERIQCRCISCYPDVTDDTCSCAWEFWIPESAPEGTEIQEPEKSDAPSLRTTLAEMPQVRLRGLASKFGIRRYSKLSKAELVEAVAGALCDPAVIRRFLTTLTRAAEDVFWKAAKSAGVVPVPDAIWSDVYPLCGHCFLQAVNRDVRSGVWMQEEIRRACLAMRREEEQSDL